MAQRVQVTLVQPNTSGPLNPALVGFTFTSGSVVQSELVARCIAYMTYVCGKASELDTIITGVQYRSSAVTPFLDQPFPVAFYGSIKSVMTTDGGIPTMTTYGTPSIGGGGYTSSGRGDSLCVLTKGATGGRHAVGKHFVPFLSRAAVTADGLISATVRLNVPDVYSQIFLGTGTGLLSTPAGVVVNAPASFPVISICKVVQVPSRLKSRTK